MNKETKENNVRINGIGVDLCRGTGHRAREYGITLIALIITIIVLLILAGVSINLVIGENGILKQAKDATTIYAQKEQEEKNALDSLYEEYLGHVNSITVEKAPANEINNWDYTLDTENKKIYLTKYKGTGEALVVYGKYEVDGVTYNTILNSIIYGTSPFYNTSTVIKSISIKNGVTSENCSSMFEDCSSLTSLDLSGLDTSKVTDMSNMFNYCTNLTTIDLSNFDTSNVTDMNSMFYNCKSLTSLDLSSFNTSKVTNMSSMFEDCSSLTSLNLSNFNTSNVTDFNSIFRNCKSFTSLNLSNFNTSKATIMYSMFEDSTNLTTVYVSQDKWITSQAYTDDMFLNCGTSTVTYKE